MSINKKILIIGDSWSQGELKLSENGKLVVTHKGTEHYLINDGYAVNNLGGIGESNQWALFQLETYVGSPDAVIWFQTDVIRDFTEQEFLIKLKELGSIRSIFHSQIIDTYNKMNLLAKQKNTTVYVVGGFSPVLEDELKQLDKLKCAIPCVIQLIHPDIHINFYDRFSQLPWFMNLIESIKSNFSWSKDSIIQLKAEWVDMQSNITKFHQAMLQDKKYFWPDGFHPNRVGHKVIYNKIKKILENE